MESFLTYTVDTVKGKIYNKFNREIGSKNSAGYIKVFINTYGNLFVHRVVYCASNKISLDDIKEFSIDHLNHKRDDNRICNLVKITRNDNSRKRRYRSKNKSKYKGVKKSGKKWYAQATYNKTMYYLGTYETERGAGMAYKNFIKNKST